MLNYRVSILLIFCLLLAACGEGAREGVSTPSPIPIVPPRFTEEPYPAPAAIALSEQRVAMMKNELNYMVREYLDVFTQYKQYTGDTIFEHRPAQSTTVQVYELEDTDFYLLLMMLGKDCFRIDMSYSPRYGAHYKYVGFLPQERWQQLATGVYPFERYTYLGEYTYYFDPACTYEKNPVYSDVIQPEDAPVARTTLNEQRIAEIKNALNRMVREELDVNILLYKHYEFNPFFENHLAQFTTVQVYGDIYGNSYLLFMMLGEDTFYIVMRHSLLHGCRYDRVTFLSEEFRQEIVTEASTSKTFICLGEFTYFFDPACACENPTPYFDAIWKDNRDILVAKVIDSLKDYLREKGEYTFLFCDYSEIEAHTVGEADIIIIIESDIPGYQELSATFSMKNFDYSQCILNPGSIQSMRDYYKTLEFDREVFVLE